MKSFLNKRMNPLFPFEYSAHYWVVREGRRGPLRKAYFTTASAARAFLNRLDTCGESVVVTIGRREVGDWEAVDRLALEAAAAEEGGSR